MQYRSNQGVPVTFVENCPGQRDVTVGELCPRTPDCRAPHHQVFPSPFARPTETTSAIAAAPAEGASRHRGWWWWGRRVAVSKILRGNSQRPQGAMRLRSEAPPTPCTALLAPGRCTPGRTHVRIATSLALPWVSLAIPCRPVPGPSVQSIAEKAQHVEGRREMWGRVEETPLGTCRREPSSFVGPFTEPAECDGSVLGHPQRMVRGSPNRAWGSRVQPLGRVSRHVVEGAAD